MEGHVANTTLGVGWKYRAGEIQVHVSELLAKGMVDGAGLCCRKDNFDMVNFFGLPLDSGQTVPHASKASSLPVCIASIERRNARGTTLLSLILEFRQSILFQAFK